MGRSSCFVASFLILVLGTILVVEYMPFPPGAIFPPAPNPDPANTYGLNDPYGASDPWTPATPATPVSPEDPTISLSTNSSAGSEPSIDPGHLATEASPSGFEGKESQQRDPRFLHRRVRRLSGKEGSHASYPDRAGPGMADMLAQDASLFHSHARRLDADIINRLNYTLFKDATVQCRDPMTANQRVTEMWSIPRVKQTRPDTLVEGLKDKLVWAGHPSKRHDRQPW